MAGESKHVGIMAAGKRMMKLCAGVSILSGDEIVVCQSQWREH